MMGWSPTGPPPWGENFRHPPWLQHLFRTLLQLPQSPHSTQLMPKIKGCRTDKGRLEQGDGIQEGKINPRDVCQSPSWLVPVRTTDGVSLTSSLCKHSTQDSRPWLQASSTWHTALAMGSDSAGNYVRLVRSIL